MNLFTQKQIEELCIRVGFSPADARIASAIAMVEAPAEGNPGFADADLIGDQDLADAVWGYSYGFFQIRSLRSHAGTGRFRDAERLPDPEFNCRSALAILSEMGFQAWATYTSGQYKAYMQDEFPPAPGTYVVLSGDTLNRIGDKLGVDWQEIARLNNLHDPYLINIGQVLKVPTLPPEGHVTTQADLDRAAAWARAQVGKPYVLGSFGDSFDCSTYMSGIATMIRDGVAKRWFTTHPFHSGAASPLPGWERNLEAPFMIGIDASGIGHTGGTLMGVNYEATAAGNRVVRMGPGARGAHNPMYQYVYGFRPSIVEGGTPPVPETNVRLSQLRLGVRDSEDVRVFQRALIAKGQNPGPVDGWYGGMTQAACKAFQVAQAMPDADGSPGPLTCTRLGLVAVIAEARVRISRLRLGVRDSEDVRVVQMALAAKGHNPGPVDGWYGGMTQAACKAFQEAQGWTGPAADGIPGPATIVALGLVVAAEDNPPPPPPPGGGDWRTAPEPAHNYARTTYGGRTVNQRTKVMLERAALLYGSSFRLTQGSYNTGVGASAGTHDGGGVVDIGLNSSAAVQALRKAGFFAWQRTPDQGFAYHIHAVAIGDREMSPAARGQVVQGFQDRDGLARRGPDPAPDPYPNWTRTYGTHISLDLEDPPPPPPPNEGLPAGATGKALYWSDEFNGPLDTSKWVNGRTSAFPNMGPINPNDNKLSYLNPSAVSFADGKVILTAAKRTGDQFWNTGLITTERAPESGGVGFELRPGDYWETRFRLPSKGGEWFSVWTWGRDRPPGYDGVQPGHGEIDKVEYHTHNGDLLELSNHVRGGGTYYRNAESIRPGAWITLGIRFDENTNIWYLNDRQIHSDGNGVPSYWRGWLILELAISAGRYNHPVPADSNPRTVEFEYTRVYR